MVFGDLRKLAVLKAAMGGGAVVLALAASVWAEEPTYPFAIFEVDGLGTYSNLGWGVNSNGAVVGSSYPAGSGDFHAFLSKRTGVQDLGTFGGADSEAWDVNAAGSIVGWADTTLNKPHAFFYTEAGGLEDIGTFGGKSSKAWALNEKNEVVGSANFEGDATAHAFLYHDHVKTDLGSLDDSRVSFAYGINESSAVVGASNNAVGVQRPVLWENGVITDLGSLGNGTNAGEARAINDSNQIVGWSADDGGTNRPFIHEQGEMFRLDTGVSTSGGFARSINNQSEVVGIVSKGAKTFGFHWDFEHGLRLLDDLIAPRSGIQIGDASEITDAGCVSARGPNPDSCDTCSRALLLVRVDPELSLSDPVPGVAGQKNQWTISGLTPSGKATLIYGLKGGGTYVPGCAALSAVVQIKKPKIIKTVTADANGVATVRLFVPQQASNMGQVLLQAVSLGDCRESQLTVWEFQ